MKILSALFLALALFTGCATRETFRVSINAESHENRQFTFHNHSGMELQNVKFTGWVCIDDWWYRMEFGRVKQWPSAGAWCTGFPDNRVTALEVAGICSQGKLTGKWSDGSHLPPKSDIRLEPYNPWFFGLDVDGN